VVPGADDDTDRPGRAIVRGAGRGSAARLGQRRGDGDEGAEVGGQRRGLGELVGGDEAAASTCTAGPSSGGFELVAMRGGPRSDEPRPNNALGAG
jgi:hypothetical protein